jgi:hypothetical protein
MVRWLFKAPPDLDLVHRMLCWVLLGGFSVFTAILITYGRLSMGLGFSIASRYKTFSLYLMVSLIYLLAIVWQKEHRVLPNKWTNRRLLRATLVALFALYVGASLLAIRHIRMFRASLLQAKAGVLLLNTVDYDYLKRSIEARCLKLDGMKDTVAALDAMGFLRPSLAKGDLLIESRAPDAKTDGTFEQLIPQGDWYVAEGHAALPNSGTPADAVLLVAQNLMGDETIFALAEVSNTGDILNKFRRGGAVTNLTWRGEFPLKDLPPGTIKLTAWAFDANTAQAYRLSGTHIVEQARVDANEPYNGNIQ